MSDPIRGPNLILCLDGCSPAYIEHSKMPNLKSGTLHAYAVVSAMMPTVTNVNVASIITGELPRVHGIAGNSWLNKRTKRIEFMDRGALLRNQADARNKTGGKTLLITVKDKLVR